MSLADKAYYEETKKNKQQDTHKKFINFKLSLLAGFADYPNSTAKEVAINLNAPREDYCNAPRRAAELNQALLLDNVGKKRCTATNAMTSTYSINQKGLTYLRAHKPNVNSKPVVDRHVDQGADTGNGWATGEQVYLDSNVESEAKTKDKDKIDHDVLNDRFEGLYDILR